MASNRGLNVTETVKTSNSEFLETMAIAKLKRIIEDKLGVNVNGFRDEYLRRRVNIRLRAQNINSYGSYVQFLNKNPQELTALFNELTVNYTTFFRDLDVYNYFDKTLFPKLFASQKPIRIWSAGCATGEEPYSLAILAHKKLGLRPASYVIIYASDVDKDALAKASLGEYKKGQLQYLDDATVDRYFTKQGETYKVKDVLKSFVKFEIADLMKEPPHKELDLILCRNVMIYFARESQQLIHMHFYNALKEGGYFVSGKAELLSGEPSVKFVQVDVKTRVYIKPKACA
jgi:chemotaxis protein methyltransferase CheR